MHVDYVFDLMPPIATWDRHMGTDDWIPNQSILARGSNDSETWLCYIKGAGIPPPANTCSEGTIQVEEGINIDYEAMELNTSDIIQCSSVLSNDYTGEINITCLPTGDIFINGACSKNYENFSPGVCQSSTGDTPPNYS
eukprot:UN31262